MLQLAAGREPIGADIIGEQRRVEHKRGLLSSIPKCERREIAGDFLHRRGLNIGEHGDEQIVVRIKS